MRPQRRTAGPGRIVAGGPKPVGVHPGGRQRRAGIHTSAGPLVLLSLAFLCGSEQAIAQARVRTAVDTTLATVGDRITLTVSVEHASDAAVVWPDSLDLAPFEVLSADVAPVRSEGERSTSSARITLAAFELGELEIPSLEVEILAADGSTEVLETDRYGVEIVSVGTDEGGDIREIRGPLAIPVSPVRIALWGLAFMLLGAVLYAGIRHLRAPPKGTAVSPPGPPPRPAHEIALEALNRLEASPLLGRGQVKEYHIAVSEIIRRYVEARFGVMALEMTTWEVLQGLERSGVELALRQDLRRFLDQCDLVKFAKVRPAEEASRRTLALARALVERSIARLTGVLEEERALAAAQPTADTLTAHATADTLAPQSGGES